MNVGNHILFLVIEGNEGNKGNIQDKYLDGKLSFKYEQEAIKCVKAWKRFGVDIPIYIICVNSNTPSEACVKQLREFGAMYFHWPQKEADDYICGYWNVPLAGKLLEEFLGEEKYIIHIDLDMTLFRPLQLDHFKNLGDTTRVAINEFRPTEQKNVCIDGPIYEFEINTGFIYSKVSKKFYKHWYERLKAKTLELDESDPSYSIWEERICDVMYFEEGHTFSFFKPYQINGSLANYNKEQLKKICFNHCHIEHVERSRNQLEEYLRRC